MMMLDEITPGAVAELGRHLGGAHDVREQHRCEEPLRSSSGHDRSLIGEWPRFKVPAALRCRRSITIRLMTTAPLLTRRHLNRSLLARQMLLERTQRPVADAIEWLVGMQAQTPISPYVALWSRLEGFDSDDLSRLITDREAVRLGLMRGTIHLVTARDALVLRPVIQPVGEASFRSSPFAKALAGIDLDEVLAESRRLLDEKPRSAAELGALLAERWPGYDGPSLAYASRFLLALVQVPPRGLWGKTGLSRHTTLEAWTGRPMSASADPEATVRRYLAAFGPATVADVRTWSWLTGLRDVVERLRPSLRTFRDEDGRELFDITDGLLADPDTPAPPRFLPDYDNIVLSHADRSRIVPGHVRQQVLWDWGPMLVDGFVAGTWKIVRVKDAATLRVRTFADLGSNDATAVDDEGGRLLAFMAAGAEPRGVTIVTDPEQMNGRVR
jgi:winged helix DNA-binding protein